MNLLDSLLFPEFYEAKGFYGTASLKDYSLNQC